MKLIFRSNYGDGGLADTLRSMFAYYIFCKQNEIEYHLLFKGHAFEKCFRSGEFDIRGYQIQEFVDMSGRSSRKTWEFLELVKYLKNQDAAVCFMVRSNVFDFINLEIMRGYRKEFIEFLGISETVRKGIEDKIDKYGLREFLSIHCRCGDAYMKDVNIACDFRLAPEDAIHKIERIIRERKERIVIFTDSYVVREHFKELCLDGNVHHTSLAGFGVIDTVIEFFILGRSKEIVMLSNSGFSYWAAFFNDVPLYDEHFELIRELKY